MSDSGAWGLYGLEPALYIVEERAWVIRLLLILNSLHVLSISLCPLSFRDTFYSSFNYFFSFTDCDKNSSLLIMCTKVHR